MLLLGFALRLGEERNGIIFQWSHPASASAKCIISLERETHAEKEAGVLVSCLEMPRNLNVDEHTIIPSRNPRGIRLR